MRCAQCGFDAVPGAAFCSRCGARVMAPRPAQTREYALTTVFPSWWRFAGALTIAGLTFVGGCYALFARSQSWRAALILFALAAALLGLIALARRSISWSLTSERLIERRGIIASRRLELELADIRSVEVTQRLLQRLTDLGNVTVASAASADFLICLQDVANPNAIAEQLRQARLKRLA